VWSWSTETRAVPDLPDLEPVSLTGPYCIQFPRTSSIVLVALFSLLIIVLAVHSWPAPTLPSHLINMVCGSLATLPALSTNNCISEVTQTSPTHHLCLSRQCMQPILILYYMSVSVTEASRVVGLMVKTNGDA
jgi:hypothetical protein